MFCTKCGSRLEDTAIKCPKCGAPVANKKNMDLKFSKEGFKEAGEKIKVAKKRFDENIAQEDLVSGNINKGHLIKFIKHVCKEKQYGIFVYEILWLYMIHLFGEIFYDPYFWSDLYENLFTFGFVIPVISLWFIMNKPGQSMLRRIMGAHLIEREEHVKRLKNPVLAIIKEAREGGLALPDDIDVYVVNSSDALAYAIGMNSIIISEGMAEQREEVFKAKVLKELYRINRMDPDYLLFMLGSNLISCIIVVFLLIFSRIDMKYGDRRSKVFGNSESKDGAIVFYTILFCFISWIGICYLFIRKHVRKNALDSDQYVVQYGYGKALCTYIDQIVPKKLPMRYKLLEFGNPSKDERVATLQKAGVDYYC